MTFDNLLFERDGSDGRVAVITINRPKVLNALNSATLDELARAILTLTRDDAVRVVVITGAGDERFLARAGEDDRAHAGVGLQLEDRAPQLVDGLAVQRVEDLGPVDGDRGDGAVALEEEVFKSH